MLAELIITPIFLEKQITSLRATHIIYLFIPIYTNRNRICLISPHDTNLHNSHNNL